MSGSASILVADRDIMLLWPQTNFIKHFTVVIFDFS
jgi:hypothetical protein